MELGDGADIPPLADGLGLHRPALGGDADDVRRQLAEEDIPKE